jgi:peptide/nickel transport system substrate-binding protein
VHAIPVPRRTHRVAVSLAAVTLALAAVLSGCSSAVQEARGGGSGKVTDGGTLHLGVATDLQTATPFSNASDATNVLIGLVYDTLVDTPTNSVEPKPSLATSWKLAADGKSLTLQLRRGVKFHSGRAFTSKDVEFSIKQWADPAWTVQLQRTAAAITSFDTSRPDSITLGFAHPLSNVFDLLDIVPIIDRDTFSGFKAGTKYVGTGPFEFGSWNPGTELTFKRNADYWGGKPHLAAVDTKIVSDPQSLVSQLRSGQLDAIIGGSNRDLESLRQGNRFDVQRLTGAEQQVYVGATLANPDLKDVRLRKAIAYAVDRPRITQDVFRGAGYPVNLPWPKYSPAYDAKLNHTYDRNVAKAKSLVKAASKGGSSPTIPLEFDSSNSNLEATAQIVQSNLQDIGVKVRLEPVDHNQFIKELIGAKFKGLWVTIHSYAQWTPSTLAVSAYPFNAEHNASHFLSTTYTKDSDAAWQVADGTSANAVSTYQAISKDLLDNVFLIELSVIYTQLAHSPRLHGVSWSKRQEIHLDKAYLSKG